MPEPGNQFRRPDDMESVGRHLAGDKAAVANGAESHADIDPFVDHIGRRIAQAQVDAKPGMGNRQIGQQWQDAEPPQGLGCGEPDNAPQFLGRLIVAGRKQGVDLRNPVTGAFGQLLPECRNPHLTRVSVEQQFALDTFQFLHGPGDGLRRHAQTHRRVLEAPRIGRSQKDPQHLQPVQHGLASD